MTIAEASTVIVSAATLVTALASLIVALRGKALAESTHELVNGQSKRLEAIAKGEGHAEGLQEAQDASKAQKSPLVPPAG